MQKHPSFLLPKKDCFDINGWVHLLRKQNIATGKEIDLKADDLFHNELPLLHYETNLTYVLPNKADESTHC